MIFHQIADNGAVALVLGEVRGKMLASEAEALAFMAKSGCKLGRVVELGGWAGFSACVMALAMREIGCEEAVTTVDNFSLGTTADQFLANVRKAAANVRLTVGDSAEAAESWRDGSIGLLFIDADHSYEGVKRDFLAWEKFVPRLGLIAYHDANRACVHRVVVESIEKGFRELVSVGGLTICQRSIG